MFVSPTSKQENTKGYFSYPAEIKIIEVLKKRTNHFYFIEALITIIKSSSYSFKSFMKFPPPPKSSVCENTFYCTNSLSIEETRSFLKKVKLNGSTVTTAVLSAFGFATAKRVKCYKNATNCNSALFLCVTSNRELCGMDLDDLTSNISGIYVPVEMNNLNNEYESVVGWNLAKEIKKIMMDNFELNSLRAGMLTGVGLQQGQLGPTSTLAITSWGAKSPIMKRYNDWDINTFEHLFHVNSHQSPTLSCYYVAETLNFTFLAPIPKFNKEDISNCALDGFNNIKILISS